jgi:hypothetical protein
MAVMPGRQSHVHVFLNGVRHDDKCSEETFHAQPVTASVNPDYLDDPTNLISTPEGFFPPSPHRALETAEIVGIVEQYRAAAANAKLAGFDGVQWSLDRPVPPRQQQQTHRPIWRLNREPGSSPCRSGRSIDLGLGCRPCGCSHRPQWHIQRGAGPGCPLACTGPGGCRSRVATRSSLGGKALLA